MRHLALALVMLVGVAGGEPQAAYRPLEFLAGSCWKGAFPDGKQTDEHCFTWMYGGKFLRDRHVVRGEGHADYLGETIYYWNPAANQVEYLYVESDGGFSRGTVSVEPGALVFPAATYVDAGKSRTYRSRWRHASADAYDVVTEFQSGDAWKEGWSVHMAKSREASP